jgi:sulfide dehydrogenase [flavocytochrome c] flavoprotein chain
MGMMRRRCFVGIAALAALMPRAWATEKLRARVVVVGGGFAGASCALALRRLNANIEVTLVDADARYVTCPSSNEVIAGARTLASITVSRDGIARAGVRVVRDRAVSIDAQARTVALAGGATLAYDRLVVAPGIRFLRGRIAGYDEIAEQRMPHAWIAGAQTEILARQIAAMPRGGVVAISVPAGLMRCPPGPYERAGLIAQFLHVHNPRAKVLIFDANNHFPRQDEFTDAWQAAYGRMIEWIASTAGGALERVDAKQMTLYTSGGAQRVAVANVIPPQAPGAIAATAGLAQGHGWCPVSANTFEAENVAGVHVIGDACIAGAMPKSASAAHSQALQCAAAIDALLKGRYPPEPEFDSVCYSLVGKDRALSIHGRFHIVDGAIEPLPAPAAAQRLLPAQEYDLARAWYRRIVADSFGT